MAQWEDLRKRRLALAGLAHALVTAATLPAMLWVLLSAVHANRIGAAAAGGLFFMTVAVLEACSAIAPAWQAWRAAATAAGRLEEVVEPKHEARSHGRMGAQPPAPRGALWFREVVFVAGLRPSGAG